VNLQGRAVAILYSPREGIRSSARWWIPLRPPEGAVDERLTR